MIGLLRRPRWQVALGTLTLSLCVSAPAQNPVSGSGGQINIVNSDMAVLEAQEVRKDLPCTVTPDKSPTLGFDLRFHAGYEISVPMKELGGGEDLLTILFRVTPANHKDDPYFFVQHVHVPPLSDETKGDATLEGMIDLGEGNYHVDWLMRDRSERVCTAFWDWESTLAPKDKQIALVIAPGVAEKAVFEQFTDDPPVERTPQSPPINVKLLVNFAPQNFDSPTLRPLDTLALVSILRQISREPQFGKFSLVAFNIQEQRVLYRQQDADKIDFPALGEAIQSMKLGTVDLKRLQDKHGDTEFLTDLITKEMHSDDHPDAVIFAGPKLMLDDQVPSESLKPFASDVNFPVFYMNYALNPLAVPWKDAISRAIKTFKGTEYTISRPRDLWFSVSEMVSRIVKSKQGRTGAVAAR
jgi:hypothetical protein